MSPFSLVPQAFLWLGLAAGPAAPAFPASSASSAPSLFQLEKSPDSDSITKGMDAHGRGTGPQRARLDSLLNALPAYLQVRSTGFAGWAEKGMYVSAQPQRFPQVYRVGAPEGARKPMTAFFRRMAGFYLNPVPGLRNFLFTRDAGGDEQFQLGLYDMATGKERAIGAPPGRVEGLIWDDAGKSFAYSHTPAGTDRWDLRLGRTDGFDTLILSLPGTWSALDLRPDGKRLLAQRYVSASQSELFVLSLEDGSLTRLLPGEKPAYADHAQWLRDTAWSVVFTSDREGEFHRLYRMRPDSLAKPMALSPAADWDVEWASLAPDRRSLVYALDEEGLSRLYYLDGAACAAKDPEAGGHGARKLAGIPDGILSEAVFRPAAHPRAGTVYRELAFTLNEATRPGDVFSYDIVAGKARRWTRSAMGGMGGVGGIGRMGAMAGKGGPVRSAMRAPSLIRYPSFDSAPAVPGQAPRRRTVPAWLYLPDSALFPGPRPTLILVHGGPEQQARPGFDPFLQFLVGKMGLAVAQPNVRGSSGYGRSYLNADDGYLRMGSVRDLGCLLDWMRTQPRLDASRVAVSGRSYGGFMSLSALVEYGPRLRAGISTVGISHFPTFLAKTSGYRRDLRRVEYGDERDPRMADFLDSISPLTRMDRINTPLLLCHGRNDPRVPVEESQRIFQGLKDRKVPVWFLTFSQEGHAVRDLESQLAQWRVTAEFLLRELGLPER